MDYTNHQKRKSLRVFSRGFFQNYLKCFGILVVCYAISASTINLLIDPSGYTFFYTRKGINQFKPLAPGNRVSKSMLFNRGDYEGVIVGSSRAMIGIDPEHPRLKNYKVFNLGLLAANVHENRKTLEFARRHKAIRLIIWGLDLFSFKSDITTQRDYNLSLFADENNLFRILFGYLLSFKTLGNSFKTFYINSTAEISQVTNSNGFNTIPSDRKVQPRLIFRQTIKTSFLGNTYSYKNFSYDNSRIDLIKDILQVYLSTGTRIILYISPVHAWQLELIEQLGFFGSYKRMRWDLVEMLNEINSTLPPDSRPVTLWDFGNYNSITTEEIPKDDNSGKQMKWFWESSHFKKELGDKIIERILVAGDLPPNDFGILLSSENVNQVVSKLEQDKLKYQLENTEEIQEIKKLILAYPNK